MGHVGSITRSLGQILEKPCVRSRDPISVQIPMKLGKNVCFDDFLDELENGSCQVKTTSLGHILESQSLRLRRATPWPSWPSCLNLWCVAEFQETKGRN